MNAFGIKMDDAITNINPIEQIKEYRIFPAFTSGVYDVDTVWIKIADIDLSVNGTIIFIRHSPSSIGGLVDGQLLYVDFETKILLQNNNGKLCSSGLYTNDGLVITYDSSTHLYSVFVKNNSTNTNRYFSVGGYNPEGNHNPIVKVYNFEKEQQSDYINYIVEQEYIDEHLAIDSFYEGVAADSPYPINICSDKTFSEVGYQENILAVFQKAAVSYRYIPGGTRWSSIKDTNNHVVFENYYGSILLAKQYRANVGTLMSNLCFSGDDTAFSSIKDSVRGGFEFYNTTLGEELIKIDDYNWVSKLDGTPLAKIVRSGATTDRPTDVKVGFQFFDTTLNKPVWHKGSNVWVDATGATV